MKLLALSLIISLSGLTTGCRKNCGPSGEPRLLLSITGQMPLPFTEVRALDALPNAPAILPPKLYNTGQSYVEELNLPINLNADRSRYLLTSATRRDTVTVNYRRVFSYDDAECGYIINLFPKQDSDLTSAFYGRIVQTTVGTVAYVYFTQTTPYQIVSLYGNGASDTGINVTLKWP